MNSQGHSRLAGRLQGVSAGAAACVFGIGVLVLIGWIFDSATLKSLDPNLISMKANTAVAFMLTGISLWLLQTRRVYSRQGRYFARLAAFLVAALGALTLLEYAFGWNLRIDQLLFGEPAGAAQTILPGRMAPNTAVNFVLIGVSLLLFDVRTRGGHRPALYLIGLEGIVAFVALTGYVFDASWFYAPSAAANPMSLPAVLAGVITFAGLWLARSAPGQSLLTPAEHAGDIMARRLLVPTLVVPMLLELVLLTGQHAGFYDDNFASAMQVVLQTAFFLCLIGLTAASLNRTDSKRKQLQATLQRKDEQEQTILDAVPAMIFYKDRENHFVRTNRAFEEAMGLSKEQLEGRSLLDIYPREQAEAFWRDDKEVMASGKPKRGIVEPMETSAGTRLVETDKIPYTNEAGDVVGVIGFAIDITDRMRAEEALKTAHDELDARVQQRTAELSLATEALRDEQQRFQRVLDQLPAYLVLLSPDYHVPFANRFFEERFGKSEGRRCYEYLFNRTEPCETCETFTVLKTRQPHHWQWTGPDGRNYDIFDFPFTDVDGSPLIMEVGLDITERKKAEAELEKHRHHLEEMVRQRTGQLEAANAQLQAVFDVVNVGMLLLDGDGVVKRVNNTISRWVGRESYTYNGDRPGDFVGCIHAVADSAGCGHTPHCRSCSLRKAFESVLNTGQSVHDVEAESVLLIDGKEVRLWLEVSADPILLDGKRHVILAMNNVTARKQAEEQVAALASFPQLNPNPIVEIDLEGRIHFVNFAAEELFPDLQEQQTNNPWLADWKTAVDELFRSGTKRVIRDVAVGDRWYQQMLHYVEHTRRIRVYGLDTTDRRRAEREREITIRFLQLVNESSDLGQLIQAATTFFQEESGCEAVGVRLKDGDDYPYYEARGFPAEFVQLENSLCGHDATGAVIRDSHGYAIIECMCGNVICGRFDPSKPFFTPHGSFWTNSTTELLASTDETERQARTRNRCNGEGYESVALLPLNVGGQRLGLLQLSDRRKGVFTHEVIGLWERLADHFAVALSKFRAEEALRESEERHQLATSVANEAIWEVNLAAGTTRWNRAYAELFGRPPDATAHGPWWLEQIHPEDRERVDASFRAALAGDADAWVCEYRMTLADGSHGFLQDRAIIVRDQAGRALRAVGAKLNVTQQKQVEETLRRNQALLETRLLLSELAQRASIEELMQTALDQAELHTGSAVGFFHFVDEDQESLTLQAWSTNTLKNMCQAEGKGMHYPISQAGVWVDCFHARVPVMHNDYAGLSRKKGLPEGHAPIVRDLAVPVLRGKFVIAIIGVGNKPTDYTQADVDTLRGLATPIMDMVARKQAEQALQKTAARLNLLAETAGELLRSDQPQTAVESLCRKVLAFLDCHVFFNFLVDEVAGRLHLNAFAGISPEEARRIEWLDYGVAVCGCAARDGQRIVAECIPTTSDPRTELVKPYGVKAYACHPILGPGGKVLGTLSFGTRSRETFNEADLSLMRAITDQVAVALIRLQSREDLRNTADDLTRSNKDLEQFAYVASHDLQEPLRMVSGFMQLLQKKYGTHLDAEADQFIEYAVEGAKRMQTLINDLLAYSRVGTHGRELVPTDVGATLDQVLDHLRPLIQEAAAEITRGELPTVRADGSQLVQLFQNLIGNALKFRGAEPPKIRVDACRKGDHWLFSVRDNGIGIDPEFRDRIFLIFQRLHTRQKYPGTGIGLAICKKIVERHGGQIWVESQPGEGSVFYCTIST